MDYSRSRLIKYAPLIGAFLLYTSHACAETILRAPRAVTWQDFLLSASALTAGEGLRGTRKFRSGSGPDHAHTPSGSARQHLCG